MGLENVRYGLTAGEEVKILRGVDFYAPPSKVVFVQEFPHHLLFEGTFEEGKVVYGVRTRRFSINKASLWCGDAKVIRIADGSLIGVEEVEDDE